VAEGGGSVKLDERLLLTGVILKRAGRLNSEIKKNKKREQDRFCDRCGKKCIAQVKINTLTEANTNNINKT
jgi:uncharacterized cysteine cluster protein YcgN (CxxCxxCC family)